MGLKIPQTVSAPNPSVCAHACVHVRVRDSLRTKVWSISRTLLVAKMHRFCLFRFYTLFQTERTRGKARAAANSLVVFQNPSQPLNMSKCLSMSGSITSGLSRVTKPVPRMRFTDQVRHCISITLLLGLCGSHFQCSDRDRRSMKFMTRTHLVLHPHFPRVAGPPAQRHFTCTPITISHESYPCIQQLF